jgi:hypothetical protein
MHLTQDRDQWRALVNMVRNFVFRDQLVAGLYYSSDFSPRRHGFPPTSVHVGFVVDKVALGQVSLKSLSVFACQYRSTTAPYSIRFVCIVIISAQIRICHKYLLSYWFHCRDSRTVTVKIQGAISLKLSIQTF